MKLSLKNLFLLLLSFSVIFSIFSFSSAKNTYAAGSVLQISPASVNLGFTAPTKQRYFSVLLKNTGTETLFINNIKKSSNKLTYDLPAKKIAPNKQLQLTFKIRPLYKEGYYTFPVSIYTNSSKTPISTLEISTTVTSKKKTTVKGQGPKLVFSPAKLILDPMKQRTTQKKTVEILNEGDQMLVIGKIRTSCGCTAVVMSEKEIKPFSKGKLQVTFDSRSYKGTVSRSIIVYSNDPAGRKVLSLSVQVNP